MFLGELASKIRTNTNIVRERRDDEHNSINNLNSSVDRSATRMAIQLRLGLLAKRRPRFDSFDCNYYRFDGTLLRCRLLRAESPRWPPFFKRSGIFEAGRVSAYRNFFISLSARSFSCFVFDAVQSEGTNKSKSRM